jgi:triosephosphate isomerase
MIFVNFKTYAEASGQKALGLVQIISDVATVTQIKIIPVVQLLDLRPIISTTKLEVWVQDIDPVTYGAHTGAVLPEEIASSGAIGTFLNHSEHKFEDKASLEMAINRAKEVGLKSLVFAASLPELSEIAVFKPDFLAYEPPEFIGKTDVSVASAQPEVISQAVEIARGVGIPLVVGAGIHSGEDVRKSLELGAVGVALATDVVKSPDPKAELLDLTEGFK